MRAWLDNCLVKWATMFAHYQRNQPQSFKLVTHGRFLPQYIYHLRRSALFRKSRISLDEVHCLLAQYNYTNELIKQETTRNVLLMIQPGMLEYSPEHTTGSPVPLEEGYMKPESVLLMDSFWNVV